MYPLKELFSKSLNRIVEHAPDTDLHRTLRHRCCTRQLAVLGNAGAVLWIFTDDKVVAYEPMSYELFDLLVPEKSNEQVLNDYWPYVKALRFNYTKEDGTFGTKEEYAFLESIKNLADLLELHNVRKKGA